MVFVSISELPRLGFEQNCCWLLQSPLEEFLKLLRLENGIHRVVNITKFVVCPVFMDIRLTRFASRYSFLASFRTRNNMVPSCIGRQFTEDTFINFTHNCSLVYNNTNAKKVNQKIHRQAHCQ